MAKRKRPSYKLYRSKRRISSRSKKKSIYTRLKTKVVKEKIDKIVWSVLGFVGIAAFIGGIIFLFWLQKLTKDLPDIDDPFKKSLSSVIYDKNGMELYRVSSKESALELINKDEYVPERLKWTFLAAEDSDFYLHPGVDFKALTRCMIYKMTGGPVCGGSTLTQQVVLNTIIGREQSYVRKLRDIILALQLERKYDKDEILNMYLNVVPQGGGNLGVKTGAKLYFGKDYKDLTLAEMAVLTAMARNPIIYSPTLGSDTEANLKRLHERTDYIFEQLEKNIDRANQRIKIANELNQEKYKDSYIQQEEITKDEIRNAKDEVKELTYKKPVIDIKAPHFIFYTLKLLQERGYNNGNTFTEAEIRSGGYKIYTTLDYSLQEIAQEYISSNESGKAGYYRNIYGGKNSALMTMEPSTGKILTMVGSKCYQNNQYIPNCEELNITDGTLFDPDVNILDTLQSPGSTNKAVGYYIAFRDGIISTESMLPDVPIRTIPGYSPRNWNSAFSGMGTVRSVLARSLNIPPLFLIQTFGVESYINTSRDFGYTTYNEASGYGPAIILGGGDVKPVEHAQAFAVFANGGEFVQHEVIERIVDKDGNEIFKYTPEKEKVADPAAIYLVNNVLNPRTSPGLSPVKHMLDRDVAGKTGTSENNRDTWFVMWSPDFVTLGWMGNNDNTPMSGQAFGSTSVEPWVGRYMTELGGEFPDKTPFIRPAGVVSAYGECGADEQCESAPGLAVAGKSIPSYLVRKKFTVCTDQPNRIARDIDILSGFAQELEFRYLKAPNPLMQKDVDSYFFGKETIEEGALPFEECDVDRNYDLSKAHGIIISPQAGRTYSDTMDINVRAFIGENDSISEISVSLDGNQIKQISGGQLQDTFSIKSFDDGIYRFRMDIYPKNAEPTSETVQIYIQNSNRDIGSLSLSGGQDFASAGQVISFTATYEGNRSVDGIAIYEVNEATGIARFLSNMRRVDNNIYEYNWVAPIFGSYSLYTSADLGSSNVTSNSVNVQVAQKLNEEDGQTENNNVSF